MCPSEKIIDSLEEYKALEMEFHRELMNICRKYLNCLDIVAIVGTLDTVKFETVELVKATKKTMIDDKNEIENKDNF